MILCALLLGAALLGGRRQGYIARGAEDGAAQRQAAGQQGRSSTRLDSTRLPSVDIITDPAYLIGEPEPDKPLGETYYQMFYPGTNSLRLRSADSMSCSPKCPRIKVHLPFLTHRWHLQLLKVPKTLHPPHKNNNSHLPLLQAQILWVQTPQKHLLLLSLLLFLSSLPSSKPLFPNLLTSYFPHNHKSKQ